MFSLPNLDQITATTSYTDIFMLTALWNIGVVGMISFGLFLIFLVLKHYQLQKMSG